jgi:hypothetical protein
VGLSGPNIPANLQWQGIYSIDLLVQVYDATPIQLEIYNGSGTVRIVTWRYLVIQRNTWDAWIGTKSQNLLGTISTNHYPAYARRDTHG